MTELQILFRINEMRGNSITLNQSIEVMGRVVFLAEVLESEASKFNMNQLIDLPVLGTIFRCLFYFLKLGSNGA